MKADIHPTYNTNVKVTCACGNSFVTGSTMEDVHVEICSACHPFFTGKAKLVDTAGRVDKFAARMQKAKDMKSAKPIDAKVVEVKQEEPAEEAAQEESAQA